MATEAQRLISISLAKIAASRCVRGGVSLHKNLLVATVLQKARYIFMEEAFHMVHGTYLNQANSKFIQQLREQERIENELRHCERGELDDDDDTSHSVSPSLDDSDLDIFSTPINSNENLNFLNETTTTSSSRETGNLNNLLNNKFNSCLKESNPSLASTSSSSSTDLIYLDLDINNRVKPQDIDVECCSNSNSISGQKRRHCESDFETEEAILSILPKSKQIKLNNNDEDLLVQCTSDLTGCSSDHIDVVSNHHHHNTDITTDNCLSLDFLSNDLSLASSSNSPTHSTTANLTMAPLDMSCNSNSSSINNNTTTTTPSSSSSPTTMSTSSSSTLTSSSTSSSTTATTSNNTSASSIDRITSLVSIFNFGNLQRSVSTPDLCSSASSSVESSCCTNLSTQHQIAMTV
jgi:trimeric autotransporter adhesin